MAYREYGMWEILDVLRRFRRGERKRAIAAATGFGRKTVSRYIKRALEAGWDGKAEPDEVLAARVVARSQPGPREAKPGHVQQQLLPHRKQIEEWLSPPDGSRGLLLTKVRELLKRKGVDVPYTTLRRFVRRYCAYPNRRHTVRVVDTEPGEVAEVDFGRLGLVPDPETGKRRWVYALIVTLPYSRHMHVHVTASQKLPDLIDGLEEAWEHFGGVTRRVILDNLKAAVTRADRYDPIFSRTMSEYSAHRGFIIDAAVAGHAKGKPHVERAVPYVRESFFRGETWRDLEHVQAAVARWCVEVAGQRIHGTTRRRPLEVFEATERAALTPLEGPHFDTPRWARCKVHPDHCVRFNYALYSVPTRHVGKAVDVRGDRRLVRIFLKGELVKVHPTQPRGGKSIDPADYPPERAAYAMRDCDAAIQRAHKVGDAVGSFAEQLLAGDFPWARLRQAQKLLRLGKKYGAERLQNACARALGFQLVDVHRVERILVRAIEQEQEKPPAHPGQLVLLPPRFLRPKNSFLHSQPPAKEMTHGSEQDPEEHPQAPETVGHPGDTVRPGDVRQEGEA